MRDFESFIKKYITNSERRHKYVAAVTSLALLVSFAVPMILTEPAVSTTINTFGDLGGILPEQLFYDGIPANSVENIAKRDGNTVNNVVYSPQYMSVAELLIGTGDNPTHRWATGLTTASSISKAAQREYFLGIASDFCVFVEEDFKPKESDAEGRVAVGRNFIFEKDSPDGNYQIGAGDFESGTALKDTDNYEGLSGFAHAIIGGNIMKRLALYTTKHIGDEYSYNYELADADKDRYKRIVVGSNFDFDESKHAAISGNSHPLVEYDNSDGHKHFYSEWTDTMDATDEKAQIYKTTTEEPLIDFKEEFKFLRKQATALSEIEAITGTLNGGELTFTGPGNEATDKVVYFKINSWSDDITSIRFDGIPPKANIVVSCPADDFKFGLTHTYINGSDIAKLRADKGGLSANNHPDSERILYNFYSATTGHIKDNANGTVFAPYADVTGNQCHLSGSLIAKSFSGKTEFGYRPYRGPASIVPAAQSGYGVPIRKVVKGTEDGLKDAVFGIFEYDASAQNPFRENPIDTLRTDEDGNSYINIPSKVDFNEYKESDFTPVSGSETDVFVEKTYAVKEISAPEGYVIDNDSTYYLITVREVVKKNENQPIGGKDRPTHVYTTITTQTYKDGAAQGSPEELKVEVQDIYGVDGIVRRIIVIGEGTGADEIYIDLDDATKTILNRISVKGQGDLITRQYIEGYGPSTTRPEEQLVWDGSFPEIERNTFSEIAWNGKQNEQSDITIDSITFYYDNPTTATETEDTNNNTKTKSQTCSIKKFTNVTNNRDNGSDRWWETITINDINDSDKQNITGMKIVYNNTNSDKKGNGIRIKDSEGNYIFGTDGLNALGIEVEGNQTNTVYYGKISTSDAQFVDLSSSNDPEPANVTTNEGSNVHTGSYTYSKTINGHTQTVEVEVPGEAKMATLNMYTQITPTDGMITIGSGENQRTLKYDENKSMILPQPSNPPTFENDYGMNFKKVGQVEGEEPHNIPKNSGGTITLTDLTTNDVIENNVIGSSYDVTLKIENGHTYVLHEEQHPDGYETAPDKYFKRDGTTIYYADSEEGLEAQGCASFNIAEGTLTMSDVKISGAKFKLQKYNENMTTKLDGAQFRLWNKDKSGNMTLVYPDVDGVVYNQTAATEANTFTINKDYDLTDYFESGDANPTYVKDGYLQPGHYVLEEVTPPSGYQAQDFDFIVKDDLEIQAVGSDYTATVDLQMPDWQSDGKQAYLKNHDGGILNDSGPTIDNVVSYEVKLRNADGVSIYYKDTSGTQREKKVEGTNVVSETFNSPINIKKFEIQQKSWNSGWDIEEITITTTDKTYKYTNGSSSGGSSSGSSGATAYNIGKIRAKDTQNGYKFDEVVFYYSSGQSATQTYVSVSADSYDKDQNKLDITMNMQSVVGVKITAKNYTGELVITNDSWKAIFNTNYENSVTFAESGTTLTFGSVPTPAPQQAPRKLTPSPAPASISSINGGGLMPVGLMGDLNYIELIKNDNTSYKYTMSNQKTETEQEDPGSGGGDTTESYNIGEIMFKANDVSQLEVTKITLKYKDGTTKSLTNVAFEAGGQQNEWKIKPEGLPLNDVTNIRIQATGFNGQFVIKENGNDWGPILGTDWNNRSINGEYKYPDDTLGTLGNDDSGANLITGSGNGKINTQSESQTIVIGCEKESDNLYWLTNNTKKLNGSAGNDAIKKFTKIEMGFNLIKEHTLQIYGDIVNSNDVKVNSTTNYVYTYECSSNPITLGNIKFQDYSNIMPYLSYIKVTADGTEYTYTNPNAQTEEEETSTPSTPSTPDESSTTTTTATNLIVSIATDESGVTYICIPNKMEGDSTEVTVVKNWKDDDCYEGDDINEIRPASIQVTLKRYLADGETPAPFTDEENVIGVQTLTAPGWSYTWVNLPNKYPDGTEVKNYTYKVAEITEGADEKLNNYTNPDTEVVVGSNKNAILTNTLKTININVTKAWEGYTKGEVTLPEVKVKLQYKKNKNDDTEDWKDVKHGTEDTYTITLTGSGWSGTFEKLWEGFDYQVVEVDPPQNWTSTGGEVDENHQATITNTLKKGSLEITKSWENDEATDRPDKIKVDVYRRTQLPESRISTFGLTQTRKPEDDNYAKLLQYSLFFYDANMCGDQVDEKSAVSWRHDCHYDSNKGYSNVVNGGFHDAGDHVMFGLPQGFTASTLGWSYYEFNDSYDALGQTEHYKTIMQYFCDFFVDSTEITNNQVTRFLYQKGNGGTDHDYWGSPENQYKSNYGDYFWTSNSACDIAANYAAALAAYAAKFNDDKSASYLATAKALYAYSTKYNSCTSNGTSGFYYDQLTDCTDEQAWAAAWLYLATKDDSYKSACRAKIEEAQGKLRGEPSGHFWNNVNLGAATVYASHIDPDDTYVSGIVKNYLSTNCVGDSYRIVDWGTWGSARHNALLQTVALSASENMNGVDYSAWCAKQMNIILGNNNGNVCLVTGFDDNSVSHVHHRGASVVKDNNNYAHTLVGALAGGPQSTSFANYPDDVNNYCENEVALDYQSGLTGAAAGLYHFFKQGTLADAATLTKLGIKSGITVNVNLTALIPDSTGWTKVGDTIELTSTNGWKYTGQYPVCDENGNNYVYMIKEVTNHAGDTVEGKEGAIYYPVSYTVNTETLMLTPNGDGGYNIKGSTLSEGNTATLKVTNKKYDNQGVTMPSAGGTGTRPYTAVGIVIISGAFAAFLITRRRKHDEE